MNNLIYKSNTIIKNLLEYFKVFNSRIDQLTRIFATKWFFTNCIALD